MKKEEMVYIIKTFKGLLNDVILFFSKSTKPEIDEINASKKASAAYEIFEGLFIDNSFKIRNIDTIELEKVFNDNGIEFGIKLDYNTNEIIAIFNVDDHKDFAIIIKVSGELKKSNDKFRYTTFFKFVRNDQADGNDFFKSLFANNKEANELSNNDLKFGLKYMGDLWNDENDD